MTTAVLARMQQRQQQALHPQCQVRRCLEGEGRKWSSFVDLATFEVLLFISLYISCLFMLFSVYQGSLELFLGFRQEFCLFSSSESKGLRPFTLPSITDFQLVLTLFS